MLPIGGRPVIEYVLDRIQELGEIRDVLIVTNDRYYAQFVDWTKRRASSSLAISVLNDETTGPENRLGAVGDVIFGIENARIDDDLLVMAGDNLCDFALSRMADTLRQQGSCIGAYDIGRLDDASKFGIPAIDSGGRVVDFEEKPAEPKSSVIAVAIYMFRRADLGLFTEFQNQGHDLDLVGGFVQWAQQQAPFYACVYGPDNNWWDIGDPQIYREADNFYGGPGV
jgi:glucose-1-phosphate thymidylyltransferase